MRILAATDFSTRSQRAVRQAGVLARRTGAQLVLVHVVDNDQPAGIVSGESAEARRYLEELTGSVSELHGIDCEIMVAAGDAFDGILRAAEAHSADLVVMGAHRKQLLRDIFIGTTIERVIRAGSFPVLMVNTPVSQSYERVMAAVDLSGPSAHAVATAAALGLTEGADLAVVHAFNPFAEGKMVVAGIDKDVIDRYVADEQAHAEDEIAAFLRANQLAADNWSLWVRKGGALEVISQAVKERSPQLLIIGTHGRSGISKFFMGSVTESVLRSIETDILAVPPKRP